MRLIAAFLRVLFLRMPRLVRQIALLVLALLLAGFFGRTASAEVINYAADDILSGTAVNVDAIRARPVTLPEVFALVERQTQLRFLYSNRRLPLKNKFVLDTGSTISLSRLLLRVSAMLDVVFVRRGNQIIVRRLAPGDEITCNLSTLDPFSTACKVSPHPCPIPIPRTPNYLRRYATTMKTLSSVCCKNITTDCAGSLSRCCTAAIFRTKQSTTSF